MSNLKFQESEHNMGIFIYEQMLQAHNDCNNIVEQNHNIVVIFFHDLMRITTNYFYKKNAIDSSYKPYKEVLDKEVLSFPYISYKDVEEGINLEKKNTINNNNLRFKKRFWNLFVELYFLIVGNTKSVGFGENIPINNKVIANLLRKKIKVKYLNSSRIKVKEIDAQLKVIKKYINFICSNLDSEYASKSLFLLIERHIDSYLSRHDSNIKFDLIVVGSLSEKTNQINAVIANRLRIPVLTMLHGEGDQSIYDEPRLGYCEKIFADYVLGHGPQSSYDNSNTKFLNSISDNNPIFIPSSSEFINKIYHTDFVKSVENLADIKWMYVPDSLQFFNNWGPYGGYINDMLYLQWQRSVVSAFPDLTYKKHPKGSSLFREVSNTKLKKWIDPNSKSKITITNENFYDVYNDCNGYIFDTVSTAFMIAVATDKPIIYFNIGKRKFKEKVEEKIRERCLWVDVDPEDEININRISNDIINFKGVNKITNLYSLNVENTQNSRDDVLINFALRDGL